MRRRSKYGAIRTEVDGITFDSKAEARRYQELKMLEKCGEITHLTRQMEFTLNVSKPLGQFEQIGVYRADFCYYTKAPKGRLVGDFVVEDVKGIDTPLSRWKRKHVEAQHGHKVQIVRMRQ